MKKFYITTSIAYTNAPPHIGFALELIQADVLARYHRLIGEDVFFLTGTDEHGSKIERAAKKADKDPEIFTDEISGRFRELTKILNISNDGFIRTTDKKRHWPTVKKVWRKLSEKGDIYKKKYKGLYCVGCEVFLKEKDLVDGKCPNHQKEPEIIEEENYFFKLKKYAGDVKKEIEEGEINIVPETRKNEILSFIDKGVEDISVSRSIEKLKWGIPVPGDSNQIIYVWFEALLNYLYPKNRWPADVQCVGKDIFRFHSLMWPAMLIALGLSRPKNILVHGFINVNGQKISKSLGNIIDPFELVKKYGTDAVRYFLLREVSSTEDGDFTYEKFEERYNADLANSIGNTLQRILKMVIKYYQGKVPENSKTKNEIEKVYSNSIFPKIDNFNFNTSLRIILAFLKKLDGDIEEKKPWKIFKRETIDNEEIKDRFYSWLEIIRLSAVLIYPFLPETANKIRIQLGIKEIDEKKFDFQKEKEWGGLKPGTKIKKGEPLFPRI